MVGEAAIGFSPGGQRFEHAVQRISKMQLLSWNIGEQQCCCMSCSDLNLCQMQASTVTVIMSSISSLKYQNCKVTGQVVDTEASAKQRNIHRLGTY